MSLAFLPIISYFHGPAIASWWTKYPMALSMINRFFIIFFSSFTSDVCNLSGYSLLFMAIFVKIHLYTVRMFQVELYFFWFSEFESGNWRGVNCRKNLDIVYWDLDILLYYIYYFLCYNFFIIVQIGRTVVWSIITCVAVVFFFAGTLLPPPLFRSLPLYEQLDSCGGGRRIAAWEEEEARDGGALAGAAESAGGERRKPRRARCHHQRPLRRPPDGQTGSPPQSLLSCSCEFC